YGAPPERPFGAYLLLTGTYVTVTGAMGLLARKRGASGLSKPWDLVLAGLATHKLSRILSKGSVASSLRAPFTRYEGPAGAGELDESVRGRGLRRAIGELITCPFCLGVWVGTGVTTGMVLAPVPARFVASVFSAVALSDFLQFAYVGLEH